MLRTDEDLQQVLQVVDELNSLYYERTGDGAEQPVFYAGTSTNAAIVLAEEILFDDDDNRWEDCRFDVCRERIAVFARKLLRAFGNEEDDAWKR